MSGEPENNVLSDIFNEIKGVRELAYNMYSELSQRVTVVETIQGQRREDRGPVKDKGPSVKERVSTIEGQFAMIKGLFVLVAGQMFLSVLSYFEVLPWKP